VALVALEWRLSGSVLFSRDALNLQFGADVGTLR